MAIPGWRPQRFQNKGSGAPLSDPVSIFARRRANTRDFSATPPADLDWQFEDEQWSADTSPFRPKVGRDAVPAAEDAEADQPLSDAFHGPQSGPRVAAVQRSLDAALLDWWRENETPPLPVLRDGLLLLEAGYDLTESQRTLLLRAAIAHQRGVLTALRYQTDPERTGLLLAESLLDPRTPLTRPQVQRLVREDHKSDEWLPYLQEEIAMGRAEDAERQRSELMRIYTGQVLAEMSGDAVGREPEEVDFPLTQATRSRQALIRTMLVALALVLIISMLFGQKLRARARDTINVPAGAHTVTDPKSDPTAGDVLAGKQTISLDAYHIDRNEVTVRGYRRCVAAGACLWPSTPASATRQDYLNNRAFDLYPMINVDFAAAAAYCNWSGMRLPTAAEWEVAAAYAPATQRYYVYPWGDRFEPRYANSSANEPNDTQPVGFYHPFGSSSLGAADMAGNVAEWTSTVAPGAAQSYLAKGGSFLHEADTLRTDAAQILTVDSVASWLGFRCAMAKQ